MSASISAPPAARRTHQPPKRPGTSRTRPAAAWLFLVAAVLLSSAGCSSLKNGYDSMMKALTNTPQKPDGKPADKSPEAEPAGTKRFALDIQYLDVGMPLPRLGKNLAVVLSEDGRKCVGLNGVSLGEVFFSGKNTSNFQVGVNAIYNFPLREGGTVTADLLNIRLGPATQRRLSVTINKAEGEPPMALFSVGSSKYAQDMYCSNKPIRWKEDIPNAMSRLVVRKDAGGLRFEYDGQLVCTSPVEPSLALSEYSAILTAPAMLHDVTFDILPDAGGAAPKAKPLGGGLEEAAAAGPFPATQLSHQTGLTRIDLSNLPSGSPIGKPGQNLLALSDEEGLYVTTSAPDGANVLIPADAGNDFSVRVLAKDAFVLSDRPGRMDRFPLFSIYYKNGFKEFYVLNLSLSENGVWNSRYVITRQGPDGTDWTTTTDYRPWNNALDFNEYKVIKQKGLIRLFFNGEFIRNEPTKGGAFGAVRVDLRQNERLYDILVRDLSVAGEDSTPVSGVKDKLAPAATDKDKDKDGEKAQPKNQDAASQTGQAPAEQSGQAAQTPGDQPQTTQLKLGEVKPYDEVVRSAPPTQSPPPEQTAATPGAEAPAKGN